MQISHLDFDSYRGIYAIGKISQGEVKPGQNLSILRENEKVGQMQIAQVFTSKGLDREETQLTQPGDIVAITGSDKFAISQTLADPSITQGLPLINISPPALKVEISANSSPFAGQEGDFSTPRQLEERLHREQKTNLGLKIEKKSSSTFAVSGRGELHLAILIETMRREGYELQVGKPEVILKEIDGQKHEPVEELMVEIAKEHIGTITEELGRRKAQLTASTTTHQGMSRLSFKITSRNLLGFRSTILSKTKGEGLFSQQFLGYEPIIAVADLMRNGALIATESGEVTSYALESIQQRGITFIGPGEKVYEGMIIGLAKYPQDLEMNICKQKKLTNFRSNAEVGAVLTPPKKMSLEESLSFIENDELLEVTPLNLRLRKKILNRGERIKKQSQI